MQCVISHTALLMDIKRSIWVQGEHTATFSNLQICIALHSQQTYLWPRRLCGGDVRPLPTAACLWKVDAPAGKLSMLGMAQVITQCGPAKHQHGRSVIFTAQKAARCTRQGPPVLGMTRGPFAFITS